MVVVGEELAEVFVETWEKGAGFREIARGHVTRLWT